MDHDSTKFATQQKLRATRELARDRPAAVGQILTSTIRGPEQMDCESSLNGQMCPRSGKGSRVVSVAHRSARGSVGGSSRFGSQLSLLSKEPEAS
jgi:hypothetical protein